MTDGKGSKGCLIAAGIWLVLIAILAIGVRYLLLPYFEDELAGDTGSDNRYKHKVTLALDSFSGYSVFRSNALKKELKGHGIKLSIEDDNADVKGRMEALRDGDVQMAVFTVDSFISVGAEMGKWPATIVMVIDETKGADALIAYDTGVKSLGDLDHEDARIILTPQSPSEFLSRAVIGDFDLRNLPEKWWIEADGAEDVYKKFKSADKSSKRAYALWEPYVSKAMKVPNAHKLLDSSKLKGYIVDILVAERKFLLENPRLVRTVIESYFRAYWHYSHKPKGMQHLISIDAKSGGSDGITDQQAETLVNGIDWKNTLENYAYFGLLDKAKAGQMQHLEDILENVNHVLLKTGALKNNSIEGKIHTLYFDKILKNLHSSNFHPGKKLNIINTSGTGLHELEKIDKQEVLEALSDTEWKKLIPVGRLRIKRISFARGTARLNLQSERELNALKKTLDSWPQYYLEIVGHARSEGDREANMQLAESRAQAAADHVIQQGVDKNRIRARAAAPSAGGGSAQSVSFVFRQMPY